MNLRISVSFLTGLLLVLSACSKSVNTSAPVSLVVVNAIPTANSIITQIGSQSPKYFSNALSTGYGSGNLYTSIAGSTQLAVFQTSDTTRTIYKGAINLAPGGIYSMFLSGDTTQSDTLFIQDQIRNYDADLAGVRFVNLSAGGKSVAINLEGGTSGDFTTLGYKGVSAFKSFNADANGPGSYNFEIRDAASGDVMTTFSWSYTDHKNHTVVIAGSQDPSSPTPLYVFQVNNY